MKNVLAIVLSAALLLTTACDVSNESIDSIGFTTEFSTDNPATGTVDQDFPIYKVVIKGEYLRSEPEVGYNVITGLDYGSTVVVLKELSFFSLVYTQDGLYGYVNCSSIEPTGETQRLSINPESVVVSSPEDVENKISVGPDTVIPDDAVINNRYPATLVRTVDREFRQKMLTALLGKNYKSYGSTEYESTDPSIPYRTVRIDEKNGSIWFYDAMVTGERDGEYQAPKMNMLPEESLPIAQKKAAEIVGAERVAIPSQSWMKYLRASCSSAAEYETAFRETDSHTFVFERQIYDGVYILNGGVKVTIGVNGISEMTIDCSNYEPAGTDVQKPISLDEALKIANKACDYSAVLIYADIVYSNYVTGDDRYNLSWYLVTDKGVFVVDCVKKETRR